MSKYLRLVRVIARAQVFALLLLAGTALGRNSQITDRHIHADNKFLRHFEEWESRDLSAHIQALYRQAVADRFPFWN